MNRNELQNVLDYLENSIWTLQLVKEYLFNSKKVELLQKNRVLSDSHKGETCFVIGNGPSLKRETRLAELAKYTVFTVNQFYRSELFDIVKPDYHVMVDPLFFMLDKNNADQQDTIERIQMIASQGSPKMIFPVDAYKYIKKEIGNEDKHIYIKERYRICEKYRNGFNMSGYLPASCNVVLTAIYCAIYMGFQNIVLLGCDMTGWLDSYMKRSPDRLIEHFSHVYPYTEQEKRRMQHVHATHSNEIMLSGFASMFHDYRIVNDCCAKLKIGLSNATLETALDVIPFSNLPDILDKLRGEGK